MLDWMNKDITIEQVMDCAEKCLRHGLGSIFPFIVGFPGERPESVEASLTLAKKLRSMSPRFDVPIFFFEPYPGSKITEESRRAGYVPPKTLEDWSGFDFIGSSGIGLHPMERKRIERFRFYNHMAGLEGQSLLHRIPQWIARWRCRRDFYGLPVDKALIEWLRPPDPLS
jgi:radical SAM superfamily enzyme YgiQ (UPF0313 family)